MKTGETAAAFALLVFNEGVPYSIIRVLEKLELEYSVQTRKHVEQAKVTKASFSGAQSSS